MLSPDDTHVFIVVAERAVGAKPTIVPNYVTETGYTEDIPGRSNVGDTQDRRLLGVLNLKTRNTVWADGSFAPPAPPDTTETPADENAETPGDAGTAPSGRTRRAERDIRWSMPAVSDDGKYVIASARSAENKDRWHVVLDPESGKTRVIDLLHDEAWVREAGGGFGSAAVEFLPDNKRIWFLSERDGWMHLYTLDVNDRGREAGSADVWQMGSGVGGGRARRPEVLHHHERRASRRTAPLHAADRRRFSDQDHVHVRRESGRGVTGRDDAGPRLLLQQQAARGVRDGRMRSARRPRRSRRLRPRPGDRSSGSTRRSSRSRRATASTFTRGSSRPRWSARGATRRVRAWYSCTAPVTSRTRTNTGPPTSASTCSTTCSPRAATSSSTSTIGRAPATAATGGRRSTASWVERTSRTSSTGRSI